MAALTTGWSALGHAAPMVLLCLALLLVLRRQTRRHKQDMAKLDELERFLDALRVEEPLTGRDELRQPRHDEVRKRTTPSRSCLKAVESPLRRR